MLKDKKVVIVGGGSGIGLAVAQRALRQGAGVVIASRNRDRLTAAAQQLDGRVDVERLDATDANSIRDFLQRVGSFDHLAITIRPDTPGGRFLDNDINAAKAAFDGKFWGQYRLVKACASQMQPGGSIVLTSGIASHRNYPGYSVVSVTNAAVEALVSAIAIELAPLRVNCVCPGFVDATPPSDARREFVRQLAPQLPLDRLADADEVAEAYLYLFGNAYSTGTTVVVDGGAVC